MTVLAIAAALRVAFLMPDAPLLSTDIWRYMHDGRVFSLGQNPYALSPAEWGDRAEAEAQAAGLVLIHGPAVDRINNRRLVTIYQPTSQWVFAAIAPADLWYPGTNQMFRAAFVGFDLLIVAMLLGALGVRGRSPWWATLYAWHPLAVTEVAWSGHQDVIGIAALLACLLLASRASAPPEEMPPAAPPPGDAPTGAPPEALPEALPRRTNILKDVGTSPGAPPPRRGDADAVGSRGFSANLPTPADFPGRRRRTNVLENVGTSAAAGVAFALAVGVKPIVLPVAAPLAWRMVAGRRWAGLAAAVLAATATLAALYAPFVLMEGGLDRMWATVRVFAEFWEWNPSIHAVVAATSGDKDTADRLCGLLLLATLAVATVRSRDAITAAMAFLFAGLLLSSTAHPWYLLWALVFVPLRPGAWFVPALWVLSLTMPWSYAAVFDRGFKPPDWVVWMEYVPVYAALVTGGAWRWWQDRRRGGVTASGSSPP